MFRMFQMFRILYKQARVCEQVCFTQTHPITLQESSMHYYISDTHFGVSTKRDRQLLTAMSDTFTHPEEDTDLWILGDFADTSANYTQLINIAATISSMVTRTHLIYGNHDGAFLSHCRRSGIQPFDTVFGFNAMLDAGRYVTLCHYPLALPPSDKGYALYGHIHNGKTTDDEALRRVQYIQSIPRALNVSADILPYFRPATLDQLISVNEVWKAGLDFAPSCRSSSGK